MLVAVEVVFADLVGHLLPGGVVEHQRTEQGLLGLDVVRRGAHPADRRRHDLGWRLVRVWLHEGNLLRAGAGVGGFGIHA